MVWASYNSSSSIPDFLQNVNFQFAKAGPHGATVTPMGLNTSSIHFVEHIRCKIFLRIVNKSKGSISLGLYSVNMFVPF